MSGLVEVSAEQKPTYIVTATATASATVAVALHYGEVKKMGSKVVNFGQ